MTRNQVRERPAGPAAAAVRGSKGGIGRPSSPTAEEVSDDLRRRAVHSAAQTAKEQGRQEAEELADQAKQSGREIGSKFSS